ncbi:unnamed protein product [Oncorhynchus mykiss]|uniref:GRAM domain-containing protein n=1 Tax=Oncorhynchus mykiss TaxID=8022 RepID=A0A060ZJK1_ONCMY|nr:unnamed protein product [Oncorhynchus mykiss]
MEHLESHQRQLYEIIVNLNCPSIGCKIAEINKWQFQELLKPNSRLPPAGQQKQVDPELFRVFYTFWKETEAEAQEVALPASVLEHLEANECVFKLSSSVKTSHGVGKIAMTQRRLFLLTVGRPGYVEITKFRDIEEVKISSAPFLLLRIPSLKIKTTLRKETFEVNLKSEVDLWHLMVKEMWAGRKMADDHKVGCQNVTLNFLLIPVSGCVPIISYFSHKSKHWIGGDMG